jgi:hypothetical protein
VGEAVGDQARVLQLLNHTAGRDGDLFADTGNATTPWRATSS